MYWLLDYAEQENLRQRMIDLQNQIPNAQPREQTEQTFPFIGKKSREIAKLIIEHLTNENDIVVDPFGGSGTFAYAALDAGRRIYFNEWEPYAYKMSTAPFRELPSDEQFADALRYLHERVNPVMDEIYKTRCPQCGEEFQFDGLFFDREPQEYFRPTLHNRLGRNGENVIFRNVYHRGKCHICHKN